MCLLLHSLLPSLSPIYLLYHTSFCKGKGRCTVDGGPKGQFHSQFWSAHWSQNVGKLFLIYEKKYHSSHAVWTLKIPIRWNKMNWKLKKLLINYQIRTSVHDTCLRTKSQGWSVDSLIAFTQQWTRWSLSMKSKAEKAAQSPLKLCLYYSFGIPLWARLD